MHVKLVKSYVESVMRYGLPVDFSAFMVAPKKGQESKVRSRVVGAVEVGWEKGGGGEGNSGRVTKSCELSCPLGLHGRPRKGTGSLGKELHSRSCRCRSGKQGGRGLEWRLLIRVV